MIIESSGEELSEFCSFMDYLGKTGEPQKDREYYIGPSDESDVLLEIFI
jgi:hypothetical protein